MVLINGTVLVYDLEDRLASLWADIIEDNM